MVLMFGWQNNQNQRRNRPWLLLWLLPYLFFGLASEGAHNHPLNPSAALASSFTMTHAADCDTVAVANAVQGLAANLKCFVCDWALHSVGQLATPAHMLVLQPVLSVVAALDFRPVLTLFPSWHIRGPPLS